MIALYIGSVSQYGWWRDCEISRFVGSYQKSGYCIRLGLKIDTFVVGSRMFCFSLSNSKTIQPRRDFAAGSLINSRESPLKCIVEIKVYYVKSSICREEQEQNACVYVYLNVYLK